MDEKNKTEKSNQTSATTGRKITTTIKCIHCGKEQEITVEIPESTETPKMVWDD
ncbi:MAG TPA: hypothetical protein VLE44_01610 [Candidatus Saccharimonadales bacterium]|nr:hypothetical protein [Candidatus Saccharimonadales bacterium]